MRIITKICFLLLIGTIVFSCKKEEKVQVHKDLIFEDNKAPDYSGVTTLQVENYVNRLYIDLIGNAPTSTELSNDVAFLEANSLSQASRDTVVSKLIAKKQFYAKLWQDASNLMTNGGSKAELYLEILTYQYVASLYYQNGDTLNAQFIDYEVQKLTDLYQADSLLMLGQISHNEFHKRFCFNLIYDEINMGTENFVVACFENLLGRYPTVQELASGKSMVDGTSTILFLQNGDSKIDFLNILTASREYYESRVDDAYNILLQRKPTSVEMGNETNTFVLDNSLENVYKKICKTDEYAAF